VSKRRISHPLALLGTAVICAGFIGLGIWQLQRAEEKQAWYDSYSSRASEAPIRITDTLLQPGQSNFPTQAYGRFDGQGQFLWDNRMHQGQPGFQVLTPFIINPGDTRILVNRGWIPLLGSRQDLPSPEIPQGVRTIRGRLAEPMRSFTLEDRPPAYDASLRQNLDLSAFAESAPYAIHPYVFRLAPDEPDGFVRVWPVPDRMAVKRHQAYAVQWFGIALAFVGVVGAMLRREIKARRTFVRNETDE